MFYYHTHLHLHSTNTQQEQINRQAQSFASTPIHRSQLSIKQLQDGTFWSSSGVLLLKNARAWGEAKSDEIRMDTLTRAAEFNRPVVQCWNCVATSVVYGERGSIESMNVGCLWNITPAAQGAIQNFVPKFSTLSCTRYVLTMTDSLSTWLPLNNTPPTPSHRLYAPYTRSKHM